MESEQMRAALHEAIRQNFEWSEDPSQCGLAALYAIFNTVLNDKEKYQALLLNESDAQFHIDVLQLLVDSPNDLDDQTHFFKAMTRLSTRCDIYPASFVLNRALAAHPREPSGIGGFADVYKEQIQGMKGFFAVKILRHFNIDRERLQRVKALAKEVTIWGHLDHPHVLPLYGICEVDHGHPTSYGTISPWQENGDIVQYLRCQPNVNRICLVADVASGVSYLHKCNIIHGDLKGVNILITSSGHACLCDFGSASFTGDDISSYSGGGNIRWQAPELLRVSDDHRTCPTVYSDMWSFACVCYEIMTGRIPFYERSRDTVVVARLSRGERPSKPAKTDDAFTRFGLTSQLWKSMTTCWRVDPRSRPLARSILEWGVLRSASDVCTRPALQWVKEPRFPLSVSKVKEHLRL
ncbi:kinase-like protein [Coprinopsis marcescibilis]|uniref:Kinase-like protein n=1 Tax=Coprinopsis marcescibilis TaxID=230819 RepID=A0A5C3KI22_COPMA|nr:kinase-like protein [Coprinopsis marcescibilis]